MTKGTFNNGNFGLMGSANFRTIGVDDVVRDGNLFGFMSRYSHGTNGIGFNYMGSVAAKYENETGRNVGVLFGYSKKKITQNYEVGGGGKISEKFIPNPDYDSSKPQSEFNQKYISTRPFDPSELTQRPQSYLFKVELEPDEFTQTVLSYRRYENTLASRDMKHDNYQIDYKFKPQNELIDIRILASYAKGRQKYLDDAVFFGRSDMSNNLKSDNNALTLHLSNAAKFEINNFNIVSKLGINYLNNEYKNSMNMNLAGATSVPFQPKGEQKITTIFLDNSFEYDIFSFDTNLNFSKWELKGHKPYCDISQFCFPKDATDIKKDDIELNYSLLFSAKFHNLFMPFISYSKTTRPPNVQEMFFSTNEGNGVNPFLKPESVKTWQIGLNGYEENIFGDDRLGFKLVYYNTHIDDYIYNKSFYTTDAFMLHLNQQEVTKFRGIEAELSYDAGKFYIKASYSRQNSNQITNETSGAGANSFGGYTELSQLPKTYATVDIGTRLYNEKLTVGMIAKYTGSAKRVSSKEERVNSNDPNDFYPEFKTEKLPNIPTIYDFYVILQPQENFTFRFEIQNLFDKNYMDALNSFNSTTNQAQYDINGNDITLFDNQARGRTILASIEYKF